MAVLGIGQGRAGAGWDRAELQATEGGARKASHTVQGLMGLQPAQRGAGGCGACQRACSLPGTFGLGRALVPGWANGLREAVWCLARRGPAALVRSAPNAHLPLPLPATSDCQLPDARPGRGRGFADRSKAKSASPSAPSSLVSYSSPHARDSRCWPL